MISRLNLASDPFRNRALPWTLAVVVSAVSLVALVYVLAEYNKVRAQADMSDRQVQAMRGQQKELDRQANEIRQQIPREQQQPLEAARALVSRKGFSWSQLFSDLEEFMPGDVQILNNHVMLHARTGYEDWPEAEKKRHLLRLWLCPPDGRTLPPVFAECYGGVTVGDRGGIVCKQTQLHAPLVPA